MDRWDRIWAERGDELQQHSAFLDRVAHLLPVSGTALDLAGGAGRNAAWLAARGLDVTVCDRSVVGLALAEKHVRCQTLVRDVEVHGPPDGPWDLVLIHHFLHRPVFAALDCEMLVFVQPTTTNLERHERPSRRFLLEPTEVRDLLQHMQIVHIEEDWGPEGRHEARVVARSARGPRYPVG
ncbi:MAG TPA: class I SAM-dependent methyltransferase [Myxococcota bacterium]|nr:class I SAM-dependent methyltransferase [Myxococcota bacterium]